jgi:8-oxo-dGTP diphosphatase
MKNVLQFGHPIDNCIERKSVYGVIENTSGQLLVIDVNGTLHLPGGGIDPGEDPEAALIRECVEEAGCTIQNLELIGSANQFYSRTNLGPMNKLGIFFSGQTLGSVLNGSEHDHIPLWMSKEDMLKSNMADFQKWAVRQG